MESRTTEAKTAIVTGAGTGIGRSVALWLARRHYRVAINYSRSRNEAEACARACEELGADALLVQADVRDEQACAGLVAEVVACWDRVDVLVNNAGVTVFSGRDDWEALTPEHFHQVYAVNALGAFQMARACAPWLKATSGCLVNVSSAAPLLGRGSSVPYLMSKGALNALTLYLARVLAPDVRVNAVCPGLVTTRWFREGLGEDGYEKLRQSYESEALLARANSPDDVAEAIGWLIEGARTMTGELLLLDAGLHLR